MSSEAFGLSSVRSAKRWFSTTHWSLVLSATDPKDPNAKSALEELCVRYWYPLYVYVRQQGIDAIEAEDLTQGFFEHLLGRDRLAQANVNRGKFRTFLLSAMQNFLRDHRNHDARVKRGGRCTIISWDAQQAEERYQMEPVHSVTPELLFDRRWATTTLAGVRGRVRAEFQLAGKGQLYDLLHSHSDGEDLPYDEIARRLGITRQAVKSAAHRLRQRLRDVLWEEVAQTVATPDEIEAELRNLVALAALQTL